MGKLNYQTPPDTENEREFASEGKKEWKRQQMNTQMR